MADRVVKVRYEAVVQGAVAEVKRLQAATADYADRGAEKVRKNEQAWNNMTTRLAVGAGLGAAAIGAMAKTFMDFDQQMSGVQAVAGATSEEMDKLRKAAVDLGGATIFSASEVAAAQGELVRAGVSVQDMLGGGLKGALDLAAAGGLELADASVIAAQAMNLFNLEGSEVPRVADVLASGANKSAADVSDLGQALQQAGTVASQTGLTLEETTATLSMFADQGIRGSDAGTSLKTMLQRLTPSSKEAQRVMDELGFSAYDASGEFIGLEGLAGELQSSFGGLDTESRNAALGVAFGSDAIRGASILMQQGADGARDYEAAMNDTGAAAKMAATMTDNLAGDLEELGGAIETAVIGGGSVLNDFFRDTTQGLTGLVDMASSAPQWLQETAVQLTAIVSVGGLGAAGVLKLGTSLVSLGDDIAGVAGKATKTSTAVSRLGGVLAGPWGLAFVGATALLGAYALEQGRTRVEVKELSETLDEQTGKITANSREWFASKLNDNGILEQAEKLGISLELVTDAAMGDADAIRELNTQLDATVPAMGAGQRGLTELQQAGREVEGAVDGSNKMLERAREELRRTTEATDGLTRSDEALKAETDRLTGQAEAYLAVQQRQVEQADIWLTRSEQIIAAANAEGEAAQQAAEDFSEWRDEIAEIDASFVDFGGALEANREAAKAWAEGQAESTESADDSWEDFYDAQKVNVDEWLKELERQVAAQTEWEGNMVYLSGRVSQGVLDHLSRLGPEGAPLVAALVNASDEELERMETVYGERSTNATNAYATAMYDAAPVVQAAAKKLGEDTAKEIAQEIANGEITVAEAVKKYDLQATVDVDADLSSADDSMSSFFRRNDGKIINMGMVATMNSIKADGGIVQRANGGVDDAGRIVQRLPMMGGPEYGRTNIMWGEPETGWEAYISGKPSMRSRNVKILEEAARRLGMTVLDGMGTQRFARGGFAMPKGWTIKANLQDTSKWTDGLEKVASQYLGSLGGGVNYGGPYGWAPGGGMSWSSIWAQTRAIAPEARMTSNFRPGAYTASGVPSLHGQGRAIDIVSGNMGATFMKLLAAFGGIASQLFYTPMGNRQIGYRDSKVARDHWDHIHLGVANGGILEALTRSPKVADTGHLTLNPGWNPPTYNGLGRDEHMVDVARLGAAQTGGSGAPAPVVQVSLDGIRGVWEINGQQVEGVFREIADERAVHMANATARRFR